MKPEIVRFGEPERVTFRLDSNPIMRYRITLNGKDRDSFGTYGVLLLNTDEPHEVLFVEITADERRRRLWGYSEEFRLGRIFKLIIDGHFDSVMSFDPSLDHYDFELQCLGPQ